MAAELAFQRAFARLLTDAEARAAFFAGASNDALAEYALADEDRQRLRELDVERVEIFAELLVANRLSKAIEALPWTTRLLASDLGRLAAEFNQRCPPRDSKKYREALAFGRFLTDRFRDAPPSPRFIVDVLRFELSVLELRFCSPNGIRGRSRAELPQLEDVVEQAERVVAMPSPRSRVVSFDHDIEALTTQLAEGGVPAGVEERSMHVLLSVQDDGTVRRTELGPPTVKLLAACDGTATFAQIVAELRQELDPNHSDWRFAEKCAEATRALAEAGAMSFEGVGDGRSVSVAG
jgi:hypothetical protein